MKRILFLGIMLSMICIAFKPSRMVQGTVTDEAGNPLAGATISIKGTQVATASDNKGIFSISIQDENAILVITSVGYQAKEIKVSGKNNMVIKLSPSTQHLDEIVVTGYYPAPKKDLTGSVTIVGGELLQGKAAGVYVPASPGANVSIKVRGAKTLNNYDVDDDADKEYWPGNTDFNTEGYDHITDNPFMKVNDNPLSTFSIDVDAAAYSNVRRFISNGQLPPAGAVRIEELINYFSYDYPQPKGDDPFGVNMEYAVCPWNTNHELVLVGLQGKKIPVESLPASNLVFLVDVSGSMGEPNKLPLVQSSLKLLVDQMREQDRVALVVYAGNAGLVLPSTSGDNKSAIKNAIDRLQSGGSTAGGAGIQLAYKTAKENFIKDGNNRVILCTDGDFNVGASSDDALEQMIEQERKSNIFLTVLGYGMGNYQDAKMQKLADKGNGNHAYIDGISEAKKVLIKEFGGTLFTIAKDVKLQLEFNPDKVKAYRLIGYENRMLAKEDFNNDQKDAGELGSGHTVTALYEIVPVHAPDEPMDSVDALRYQKVKKQKLTNVYTNEILNVKLRYKAPDGDVSRLLQFPLTGRPQAINATSDNFRFAAAVASFGMVLRDSKYKGRSNFALVHSLGIAATGKDTEGYRKAFLQLAEDAALLKGIKATAKD
ncbi:von Willebrand factor type A domain-containing protein [Panacibacter sp. DH6]|uniref:von Willebrand factor type A domain-containing protein n=1 Tax=Panacibacter microcysteis TaxID=2793269 RepID=A0A931E507_9BACT|nr:VWA domain-containing protein [Panacibacter microcysteis]MBG9375113.1 von Willebrand factor type A domain-containing protein [Panacibacter microcysteis]